MSYSTGLSYQSMLSFLLAIALATPCLSQDTDAPADYRSMPMDALVKLAEKGDAVAQRNVGLRYYAGSGVQQDLEKANSWFRQAAEKGDHEAQCNLGASALNGWGMEKDFDEAHRLLTLAADGGLARAQNLLGIMSERGQGTEKDMKTATTWYRKSAEQGFAAAQCIYGTCLIQGRGVGRNIGEGVKWLKRAADQRDPTGLHNYGYACEAGWIGKQDLAKAAELYKQAVYAGYKDAYGKLKRLAESGNPDGQFQFGLLFEYGMGTEKDHDAARQWYQKAADQDHTAAIAALGACLQFGAGGPKDIPKAIELYNKAARRGNALALNFLGECYFGGKGVEVDKQRGVTLVKMAARQDLPAAITNHGWVLASGALGDPDIEHGSKLYYRAAALGHRRGMEHLRALADQGHEAAKTYLKKIESGDTSDVSIRKEPQPEVDASGYSAEAKATMRGLVQQLQDGNFNDAIDGLYEHTQEHPGDDIAWNLLGMAYEKKDMPWEAKVAMDRAIAANPTNPKYYIIKTGFLRERARFHEAAETMEKAARRVSPSLSFLAALVEIESKAKRFRHVIEYGEMIWALERTPTAAFHLAVAHHFLGNHDERDRYVEQYKSLGGKPEKLTDIFATSEELKKGKEEILKKIQRINAHGHVEKLNEQVLRYLNYDPLALELWGGLGMFYLNDREMFPDKKVRDAVAKYKDYPKAIEFLATAAYFDDGDIRLHQRLASAMTENGEFERARAQYRKTMKLFPKAANTYSYAAMLELKIGDHEEAIRLAEKARQIDGKNPEVTAWLAAVYHYTGDTQKRDRFRKLAAGLTAADSADVDATFDGLFGLNKYWDYGYYGNSAVAHNLIERVCDHTRFVGVRDVGTEKYENLTGREYTEKTLAMGLSDEELKWRQRQLARACRAYLKEYPKSFYIQSAYGHMCSVLGRFEEAEQCFNRSIEINPDFGLTYAMIGSNYYFCKMDVAKAIEYYTKAREKDPTQTRGPDIEQMWRGHWLENDKSFKRSIRFMTVFWEADRENAAVAGRLAEAYHHHGDVEKRDEFIEHARKLKYKEMDRLDALVAGEVAYASDMFREMKDAPKKPADDPDKTAAKPADKDDTDQRDASEGPEPEKPADSGTKPAEDIGTKNDKPTSPPKDYSPKPKGTKPKNTKPIEPQSGQSKAGGDRKPKSAKPTPIVSKAPPVAKGKVRVEMDKYYLDVPKDWLYTGHEILRDAKVPEPFECVVIPRERVLGNEGTRMLFMTESIAEAKSSEELAEQAKKEILGQLTSPKVVKQEQIQTGDRPAWRIRVTHGDPQAGKRFDDDFYFWHCDKQQAILVWCMTPAGEERGKYGKQFTAILRSLRHKPSNVPMFGGAFKDAAVEDEKQSETDNKVQSRYMPRCDASNASKAKCKQADKLVEQGKYAEAIRLYNEAIQLDRGHVCAYTGIGLAEGLRGRKQTAMDQMNRTVDMFPNSALALIERGRFALTINRVDITEKDADKAIKLSYCGRAYELRAYCFLERGQDKAALNYLDMAIKVYPSSPNAFKLRARAHRGLGNKSQAAADEKKAAELEAAGKSR